MYDVHGKIIYQNQEPGAKQQHTIKIDASNWLAGMYMMRVHKPNGIGITKKIVIKH